MSPPGDGFRRSGWLRIVLHCLLLAFAGCDAANDRAASPRNGLPNIVLVTLDTTRADHLGAYGYFRDTSPNFDRLAADAVFFESLVVPMATTLPTHLSILTSRHPLEHGVLANTTQGGERFVPAPGLVSFAMTARAAGYATAAFVSAAPLKRGSGIEVGFETFDQPVDKHRSAGETTAAAIAWLTARDPAERQAPYFLWVHFYDAHWPFEAPPPFDTRFRNEGGLEEFIAIRAIHPTAPRPLVQDVDEARSAANGYDAELLYQDAELGRLLEAVRAPAAGASTVIAITGDHGEGLCQHGEAAHGGTWHEQLHAPLALLVPGVPPRRVRTPLSSTDILPTLLGLLAPEAREAFGGFVVAAAGSDVLAEGYVPQPILSQDTGRQRDVPYRYALTADGFKYFRIEHADGHIEEQLYDLGADPHELRDVADTHAEMLAGMRERTLAAIETRTERGVALRGGHEARTVPVDPALLRELCALGYLEPGDCAELPPPPSESGSESGDAESESGR